MGSAPSVQPPLSPRSTALFFSNSGAHLAPATGAEGKSEAPTWRLLVPLDKREEPAAEAEAETATAAPPAELPAPDTVGNEPVSPPPAEPSTPPEQAAAPTQEDQEMVDAAEAAFAAGDSTALIAAFMASRAAETAATSQALQEEQIVWARVASARAPVRPRPPIATHALARSAPVAAAAPASATSPAHPPAATQPPPPSPQQQAQIALQQQQHQAQLQAQQQQAALVARHQQQQLAEKQKADAEAKAKAEREKAEKEKAEKDKLEKEKAEKEKAEHAAGPARPPAPPPAPSRPMLPPGSNGFPSGLGGMAGMGMMGGMGGLGMMFVRDRKRYVLTSFEGPNGHAGHDSPMPMQYPAPPPPAPVVRQAPPPPAPAPPPAAPPGPPPALVAMMQELERRKKDEADKAAAAKKKKAAAKKRREQESDDERSGDEDPRRPGPPPEAPPGGVPPNRPDAQRPPDQQPGRPEPPRRPSSGHGDGPANEAWQQGLPTDVDPHIANLRAQRPLGSRRGSASAAPPGDEGRPPLERRPSTVNHVSTEDIRPIDIAPSRFATPRSRPEEHGPGPDGPGAWSASPLGDLWASGATSPRATFLMRGDPARQKTFSDFSPRPDKATALPSRQAQRRPLSPDSTSSVFSPHLQSPLVELAPLLPVFDETPKARENAWLSDRRDDICRREQAVADADARFAAIAQGGRSRAQSPADQQPAVTEPHSTASTPAHAPAHDPRQQIAWNEALRARNISREDIAQMQLLQVVEQQIATMQQQQQLVHADHYHRAQATGLQQLQIPQHPQQSYYAHEPNSISPVSPIDYQHEQQQALMRMAMANEASQYGHAGFGQHRRPRFGDELYGGPHSAGAGSGWSSRMQSRANSPEPDDFARVAQSAPATQRDETWQQSTYGLF